MGDLVLVAAFDARTTLAPRTAQNSGSDPPFTVF